MPEYITKERAMDCVYEAVKATDANAQDLYAIRRKIANEPGIGWVSVKDRMPEKRGRYLLIDKNGIINIEYWMDGRYGKWMTVDSDDVPCITHWMPLPKPPEEVKLND